MRGIVVAIAFSLVYLTGNGQHVQRYRDNIYFDRFATALSANHLGPAMKKIPRLELGYGLRFTTFVSANQYYTTAPSKYTSPIQNPGTLFSRTLEENIDTIATATSVTHSFNATDGQKVEPGLLRIWSFYAVWSLSF